MKDKVKILTMVDNTTHDLNPMQVMFEFIEEFII